MELERIAWLINAGCVVELPKFGFISGNESNWRQSTKPAINQINQQSKSNEMANSPLINNFLTVLAEMPICRVWFELLEFHLLIEDIQSRN